MTRLLASLFLIALFAPTFAFAIATPNDFWNFDSNLNDAAGSVTLTNNNSATFVSGLIGQAISLNGTNQTASHAQTSSIDPTSALTVCAWVFPLKSNTTATQGVVTNNYASTWASPYTSYMLRLDSGPAQLEADIAVGGTLYSLNPNYTFSVSTWYFLCETYSGTTQIAYVNAVNEASQAVSGSLSYSGGTFAIGVDCFSCGGSYLDGYVDMVGVWPTALSQTDITSLYNSGGGLQYPFSATATGYNANSSWWELFF